MCTHCKELIPLVLYKGCLMCAPISLWCVILAWNFSPEPKDPQTHFCVVLVKRGATPVCFGVKVVRLQ